MYVRQFIFLTFALCLLACSSRNPSDGGPNVNEPHPDLQHLAGTWLVVLINDSGPLGPRSPLPNDSLIYTFNINATYTATSNDSLIGSGRFAFGNVANVCVQNQTVEALQMDGFPPNEYSFSGTNRDTLNFESCSVFSVALTLTKQ